MDESEDGRGRNELADTCCRQCDALWLQAKTTCPGLAALNREVERSGSVKTDRAPDDLRVGGAWTLAQIVVIQSS